MEMKNPPHSGELIGDSLGELAMSISAAAKGLGITRQQLHDLIAGRSRTSPDSAYLHISSRMWRSPRRILIQSGVFASD